MAQAQNSSLYVGDLHKDVGERDLFEHFSQLGQISSVRICRDNVSKVSLGYAYVNYVNIEDAKNALDNLNHTDLKGSTIRISPIIVDKNSRLDSKKNLFVKNLPLDIDAKFFHDIFTPYGDIVSSKLAKSRETGKFLNYGFVNFLSEESAIKALNELNEKRITPGGDDNKSSVITIEPYKPRDQRATTFTNVYVKNVPKDWNVERFTDEFKSFGNITSAVVATDNEGVSKGFGFVNFSEHADAVKAIEALHDKDVGVVIDGKNIPLYVQRFQPKSQRNRDKEIAHAKRKSELAKKTADCNLYIKNISPELTDEGLKNLFSRYGNITSAKIMTDNNTGKSRGFGFVCFASPEEAKVALESMNNTPVEGRPLYVAIAQSKGVRHQYLSQQYNMQYNRPYNMPYPQGRMQQGQMMMYSMYPPRNMYMPPQSYASAASRGAGGMNMFVQPVPRHVKHGKPSVHHRQPPQSRQQAQPSKQLPKDVTTMSIVEFAKHIGDITDRDEQIGFLGERLYPLVEKYDPERAPKITGMLLEMDVGEILQLLEQEDDLKSKVREAQEVLESVAS